MSNDDAKRLEESAKALDRIIAEAHRTKALVQSRLQAIRNAGRPSTPIERRKRTRKSR